ncbi:DUF4405 domain-containing protein [Paenibacillus sp. HN-1]|uniref:DUF4405 domain-containing protein n=1 Tax=Paenibacillus TaxID=44249 RepID=UPI001CA9BED3|nr:MULTISPECIES: DUF4405 domain-containing protein [Paenibacillus]MBY9078107.1 DUF4405 domain-containing protein [Paenibacillus sp. CGMCC 1.18879]MBY9083848.1 DUF4405 domain-containing protein [Paenibacillus sinensis]
MKNKKSYVKLTLDLLMGVTFALLYNTRVLGGLAFHEIAGIAIGFAFVIHIVLNWRFVQKITVRLFDKSLPARTRFSYLLNVLLLLSMSLVIFSGLVISRVVLPNFQFVNENWFKIAHMAVAYLALGLIGVHIGIHWHWVIKVTQKLLNMKLPQPLSRALMTGAAVLVLVFGAYQAYETNYLSKLQMVKGLFTASAAPGKGAVEHGGMDRSQSRMAPNSADDSSTGSVTGSSGANEIGDSSNFREREGKGGFDNRGFGSDSWYEVLFTYTGIMAVFAGITYYLDKWIASRRKKVRTA